jgi:glutathione S-transferase
MLKLCGFAVSNYHNKVKFALLEKGVPFEEELVYTSQSDDMLRRSPMGKVPFIETPVGSLCESQVICEYLEEAYPQTPLYPSDPFERAKVRELCTVLDLHIELQARRLYPEAFFGGTVSDETKEQAKKALARGLHALVALAKWGPFIAGDKLTYADCSAMANLPLVTMASKKIYGEDMLAGIPQVKEYIAMMRARPHMQKIEADRKINQQQMAERAKK